jgi:hypothetical protein
MDFKLNFMYFFIFINFFVISFNLISEIYIFLYITKSLCHITISIRIKDSQHPYPSIIIPLITTTTKPLSTNNDHSTKAYNESPQ